MTEALPPETGSYSPYDPLTPLAFAQQLSERYDDKDEHCERDTDEGEVDRDVRNSLIPIPRKNGNQTDSCQSDEGTSGKHRHHQRPSTQATLR
jgi:hypothetical protein